MKTNKIIYKNYYRDCFKRTFKSISFIIPLCFILIIFITGFIFSSFISSSVYSLTNLDKAYISPCIKFPFGTNSFGHNQFYIILIASFNTLSLSFCATLINLVIGSIVGVIWGFNKKANSFMFIVKNLFDNTPLIFFYIIVVMILGDGFIPLLLVVTLSGWLDFAFLIRNNIFILKSKDYNKVSQLYNVPVYKRALNNYLPSIFPILFNRLVLCIPQVIALEITISYFGFSFGNNAYSLGTLIHSSMSQNTYFTNPYMFFCPLLVLFTINICFYYISKTISKNFTKEEI